MMTWDISGFRNYLAGGQLGYAREDQFRGQQWVNYVKKQIRAWKNFYTDWLENNPMENVFVLHYEHLKQNLK